MTVTIRYNDYDEVYELTSTNANFRAIKNMDTIRADKDYLFIAMKYVAFHVNNVLREECLFEVEE